MLAAPASAQQSIAAKYKAHFDGFGFAYYRDSRDSVAMHRDREMRWLDDTLVAIVVLGGMGSLLGVAVAAVLMIGGTEIMRELDFLKQIFGPTFDPTQYRMLLFGFAMVLIMIWRPRGLIATREPSVFLKERKSISADLINEGHG